METAQSIPTESDTYKNQRGKLTELGMFTRAKCSREVKSFKYKTFTAKDTVISGNGDNWFNRK